MASQVERVFYGSNQVPGQQLSREDIKQLRFRIKRDGGTIGNVVFDPLVGQDLYMACLRFFKNYSHGSTPTEVGHYEVGNAGANGNDFAVEINNQEIFLFREDDLVLTDAEFDRLRSDLIGWTPVALRSMSADDVQHQWLYLDRGEVTGIRFISIEDTKARIAVIAPNSPHTIAISDAFDTSLFELKANKTSYIDPTINQSGNYLGGSAVNDFVEKRTFAISVPYQVSNDNTFTKILEYNELYSSSTSRGAIFARLKIQFVDTYLDHRLREVDAYIGYDLYNKKPLVTFGNCYKTVYENDYDLKNLHIVTYDSSTRCRIEVYLEHRKLTSMRQWISVEVCENFQIVETSYGTRTSHSNWKIPLTSNHWDMVNGASIQPTAAALPSTGVLKTDSYIIQSGNQVPFTYMPFGTGGHDMAIAKLVGNPSDTRLVFKLYCKREGWVAIGKVERASNAFRLSFSAISDHADFEAGVGLPYIYLSLLDGVYYVNLNIDSYHSVLESIAIEVENAKKDWEFFGSVPPDSVGTTVEDTNTYMKADPTAEVIDQGTNVPAPTSSTKVLTKQTDYAGREFWKTEEMSNIPIEGLTVQELGGSPIDLDTLKGGTEVEVYNWSAANASNVSNKPFADASTLIVYPQIGLDGYARQVCYRRGTQQVATRDFAYPIWTPWREICLDNGYYEYLTSGRTLGYYSRYTEGIDYCRGCLFRVKWEGTKNDLIVNARVTFVYGAKYPNSQGTFDICVRFTGTTSSLSSHDIKVFGIFGNKTLLCQFGIRLNNGYLEVWGSHLDSTDSPSAPILAGARVSCDFVSASNELTIDKTFVQSATWPTMLQDVHALCNNNTGFINVTGNVVLPALSPASDCYLKVRNAGSSSITITAGTLTRTLSPTQSCDVYGYNGTYVQIS